MQKEYYCFVKSFFLMEKRFVCAKNSQEAKTAMMLGRKRGAN